MVVIEIIEILKYCRNYLKILIFGKKILGKNIYKEKK